MKLSMLGILLLSLTPRELGSEIVQLRFDFDIKGECMPQVVEDWQWVVETILQEASSESFKGMIMVAEVIRDRAETKYNSDGTIIGTVLAPKQFSGWDDYNRIRVAKMDMSDGTVGLAMKAYEMAFKGRSSYAMGANLYHADTMPVYPDWTKSPNVVRLTQEGHHIFYKETRDNGTKVANSSEGSANNS